MRWARSHSIIDHDLLQGGYLHRLRHESIILYLFLEGLIEYLRRYWVGTGYSGEEV